MKPLQNICTPSSSNRAGRKILILGLTAGALLILTVLSFCLGSSGLSPEQLWRALIQGDAGDKAYQILMYVRLPRTLGAVLAGGALAVSGALLQAVLGNPLASPNVIGVNSGAGLFTMAAAAFFPGAIALGPVFAFIGALVAALAVYAIATRTGASRRTIVLAGMAVSSFLGAFTDIILTLFPETQMNRIAFMIGGFSGLNMSSLSLVGILIPIGIALAIALGYELNVLSLGEEVAGSLGLRAGVYRTVYLALAALLAGCAVSFAGLLGFVGLIVPHAARFLIGTDQRYLIPMCALAGGGFTLACDIVARTAFAPFELPVGIIMSILGGPFFVYLLFRRKGGMRI